MSRRARPNFLSLIVNELLAGVSNQAKENEETEGKRDISCLGKSPNDLHEVVAKAYSSEGRRARDAHTESGRAAICRERHKQGLPRPHKGNQSYRMRPWVRNLT